MPTPYKHKLDIRFFDIDANQHVNNSVYFTYMEHARTTVLMDAYRQCQELGVHFVVVEANCKYKRPIFLQDDVWVEMEFDFSGTVKFQVHYYFKSADGQLYAQGHTVMACVDAKTQRPVRLPQSVKTQLQQQSKQ